MRDPTDAAVVVIGAGPAGLVSSLLLSRYEIKHILVEKYPTMAHTPRAHIVNQRTVEILRDLGLESDFYQIAMPWHMMTNTVWHTSLTGLEVGRRESWGTSAERHADYTASSPCKMGNCGQHVLEPFLFEAVRRSPFVDVRLNHDFRSLEQHAERVEASIVDRTTGEQSRVRCRYLIGADGGRSRVAQQIGLTYDGEEGISASATIHFHADLSCFVERRPGALYWHVAPGVDNFRGGGTLICYQPWHDWALAVSYDPAVEDATDELSAILRLHRVIGDDSVDIQVQNISAWMINHLVATEYSRGRVFCVGDAVHRHPPTNGLGLNTSIADAYNLAWKLAMVLSGRASERLLDTYSDERQPVGRQVVDRAYKSIADMRGIRDAVGFTTASPGQPADEALAIMYAPDAPGAAKRAALAAAIRLTDYQFNAHGVEVGYRYRSRAVVSDGTPEPLFDHDPELYYHPTTWPGAHLPHAWIEDGHDQISTYDIVGHDGFTLLTGIGGEAWAKTAAAVSQQLGLTIHTRFIGTPDGYVDCYGDWRRLAETSDSGCVLVRPDRHIAWRAQDCSRQALDKLSDVVAKILALD